MTPRILISIKNFLLDIFFPRFCLGCKKEGNYLCEDCFSLIEILEHQHCPFCSKIVFNGKTCESCRKKKKLDGIYFATLYENPLVKKMIHYFKYEPFVKELAKPLTFLIITHLLNLNKTSCHDLKNKSMLLPIPLHRQKLKWRGFNQSEEIAKELSEFLKVPVQANVLTKPFKTQSQTGLKVRQRIKNVRGAFEVKRKKQVKGKTILLIDDVLTTGSTMEEAAFALKQSGAKEVWGIVVAREKT